MMSDNNTLQNAESTPHTNKKTTARQVLAFIGIGLLVALYVVALIMALIGTQWARNMLILALIGTFVIPITLYLIMMFYKLSHRGEPQTIEVPVEKDPVPAESVEEAVNPSESVAESSDSENSIE